MLCFGLYTYVKATESRAAAIAGKSAVVQALVSAQPAEERCAPSPRLGAVAPPPTPHPTPHPPPPTPPHTRLSPRPSTSRSSPSSPPGCTLRQQKPLGIPRRAGLAAVAAAPPPLSTRPSLPHGCIEVVC
jgi:hypothetical protein